MIEIPTATVKDTDAIRKIALPSWQHTYSSILSAPQLSFMLQKIYNAERLKTEIEAANPIYLLLQEDGVSKAFAAYAPRMENEAVYKLHKLYCLPEEKGKGFGKALLKEVEQRMAAAGKKTLELNVNKFNPTKSFYEKMGFEVSYEEDIPIGEYWMNDYVMRKQY